jgi:hypothetical protein
MVVILKIGYVVYTNSMETSNAKQLCINQENNILCENNSLNIIDYISEYLLSFFCEEEDMIEFVIINITRWACKLSLAFITVASFKDDILRKIGVL